MKQLILTFLLLACRLASAAEWLTDAPAAQAKARAENKLVFLYFTGSDWCGWCKKLKGEILSTPQFEAYARGNLVLVELDFPRRKAQSPALQEANQALAQQYGIEGYPTVIVLDSFGRQLGQLGYEEAGPEAFLAELQKLRGAKPSPVPAAGKGTKPGAGKPGEAPSPPPAYSELALRGISGPKDRRLALINNETLGAGESAKVKLGDTLVRVRCLEVREDSVLIRIEGREQPVELKLRGRL
jgi:protein disulfide-isomerase